MTIRLFIYFCSILSYLSGFSVQAQLRLVHEPIPLRVFSGSNRQISVKFNNTNQTMIAADLRLKLVQASSATAITIGERGWKNISVLPGQTVLESVSLDFPAVKSETRFLVRWISGESNFVGMTEVFVYPTNLLAELTPLLGGKPIGVYEPKNRLKTLLTELNVEFTDLLDAGTDKYSDKVAIFGPFESKKEMGSEINDNIRALIKRGVAVVWILPPTEKHLFQTPIFNVMPEHESSGVLVVSAHDAVAGLEERPDAQLNLLRMVKESLHPSLSDILATQTHN